jgi:hypothetical protein
MREGFMEIAVLAVLSMAVGSLITGGLIVLATRPHRGPAVRTDPAEPVPVTAEVREAPPEGDDGKPTIDEQLRAIYGYERKGGLKTE